MQNSHGFNDTQQFQQPVSSGMAMPGSAAVAQPVQGQPYYGQPPAQAQNTEFQQSPQQMVKEEKRHFESYHVYGKGAALCFNMSNKTKKEGVNEVFLYKTLNIDGAVGHNRVYNWEHGQKVTIQLTKTELPELAAVLIGAAQKCEFRSHGPNKTKGFSAEHQGKNVYFRVWDAEKKDGSANRDVPIFAGDLPAVTSMVLRQLKENLKLGSISETIEVVRSTTGFLKNHQ